MAASGKTTDRLTFDFSLPGQPGHETSVQINKTYGNGGENQPSLLVLSGPAPISTSSADAAFAAVQKAVPQARIVGQAQTGDPTFVRDGGRVQYALAFWPTPTSFTAPVVDELQRALATAAPAGTTGQTTG